MDLQHTSEMWLILKTFKDQYHNRNPLPYSVSVEREELNYAPLSKIRTTFANFSFFTCLIYDVYCILRLGWVWKSGLRGKDELEIIRIYLLLFFTFLPLAFMYMGYVLSYRPMVVCNILNHMKILKTFAQGKN